MLPRAMPQELSWLWVRVSCSLGDCQGGWPCGHPGQPRTCESGQTAWFPAPSLRGSYKGRAHWKAVTCSPAGIFPPRGPSAHQYSLQSWVLQKGVDRLLVQSLPLAEAQLSATLPLACHWHGELSRQRAASPSHPLTLDPNLLHRREG